MERMNEVKNMAKRNNKKDDDRLNRMVIRNWIICGVSLLAIIILSVIAGK